MALNTMHRLSCDYCVTEMRGRRDEQPVELRARARRSGWRQMWGMPAGKIDACQVCAPKLEG